MTQMNTAKGHGVGTGADAPDFAPNCAPNCAAATEIAAGYGVAADKKDENAISGATLCATGADERFHYPALRISSIYDKRAVEALETMCTPLDVALAGDLLALRIDMSYNIGLTVYSIIEIVVMGDAGPEVVAFPKAPQAIRKHLSMHILDFQAYGFSLDFIGNIGPIFDRGDGETTYLTATVLPGAALVHLTNFENDVFDCEYYGEDISQDAIDSAMTIILDDWESNHVLMARITDLNNALDIFRAATSIVGRQYVDAPKHRYILGAPDFPNVEHMDCPN